AARALEIRAPPRHHIVAQRREAAADEVRRHRRAHDAEADDADNWAPGPRVKDSRGRLCRIGARGDGMPVIPDAREGNGPGSNPLLHLLRASTAANSASIDSRGMLRTM